MDNLCHTLTGAAFAEAGLKRSTRFGSATLIIAANLPDIDVLSFLSDTPVVALRRGWTHGVLAQATLPVLLTTAMIVFDKWWPPRAERPRLNPLSVLLLSFAGILSHVGMDWLNTYGVRLLMPFSGQWFYGDSVFIVDPWLWLTLGAGVMFANRRRNTKIAVGALALATLYMLALIALSGAARGRVLNAWTAAKGTSPAQLMVGPVPVDPLGKTIIIDAGDYYERGSFRWWPGWVRFDPEPVPKNARHPAVIRAAAEDPDFRAMLIWSRFPFYEVVPVDGGTRVTLQDMRFAGRGLFRLSTVVRDR